MKPLVYIAGPYTHPDPIVNVREAVSTADILYEYENVIPVVPHLTMFWHLVHPHPVEFWYEYDLCILRRCDAVFRMKGESTGADAEVDLAEKLGLPVFGPYIDPRFREWVHAWAANHTA